MLSRLALRTVQERLPCSTHLVRQSTSVTSADGAKEVTWERRKRPIYPGKVRMGFIPEEWFQNFYPKTGVTGPYAFGFGFLTYLLSKEIIVMEHENFTGLVLAIMATFAIKKFGPGTAEYLDKLVDEEDKIYEQFRDNSIQIINKTIENEKFAQWQAEGLPTLYEAKRENIAFQLEAAYRKRLAEVHQMVKQKLDYQLETANVLLKFEHRHMVNWIVEQVRKGITPTQETAILKQCMTDLKSLAAKA